MKRHCRLLLFLLTFFSLQAYCIKDHFYFRNYSNYYKLPNNTINGLVQDSKGFIWVGTDVGVFRFDGRRFISLSKISRDEDSYINSYISILKADSCNCIWFSDGKELSYLDGTSAKIHRLKWFTEKSLISDVLPLDSNRIWIASADCLLEYHPQDQLLDTIDAYMHPVAMNTDASGIVWIADASLNIHRITHKGEKKVFHPTMSINRTSAIVRLLAVDDHRILLATNNKGLFLYDCNANQCVSVIENTYVHALEKYTDDEFWVGAEGGIYLFDPNKGSLRHISKERNNPFSIQDNAIYALEKDREGGMWVGSYFQGVSYLPNRDYSLFNVYVPGQTHADFYGNVVREFCRDKNGTLWVGTEDHGLNRFNPETEDFVNYSKGNLSHPLHSSNIHGLLADGDDLWVGSFDQGIQILDINTGHVKASYKYSDAPHALKSDFVLSFLKSKEGHIWVGTNRGVQQYNKDTHDFSSYFEKEMVGGVFQMTEDHKGRIWFATTMGLFCWDNNQLKQFQSTLSSSSVISSYITQVKELSNGEIWVATNKGLSRYLENGSFQRITMSLANPLLNTIYRIEEDDKGNIWLSTSQGLIRYTLADGKKMLYTESDGLIESKFNFNSSYKDNEGIIYFGTLNGFVAFNPDRQKDIPFYAPLYLVGVSYLDPSTNENVEIDLNESRKHLLHLDYDQNFISFDVVSLCFTSNASTEYNYYLEGAEKTPHRLTSYEPIVYQNLAPGHYTFHIQSTNGGGVWQDNEVVFSFVINPPFWASIWAYLVYALLLILFIWRLIILFVKREKRRNDEMMKELESEKEKELYTAKINFFTTIAHEIRTPLTLISLPVQKIMEGQDKGEELKDNLRLVDKNTKRLIQLCTQLLDFRKLESGKSLRLNFIRTNLNELIQEIWGRFDAVVKEKNLMVETDLPEEPVWAAVDREAFTKICSNLFNNASKYADSQIKIVLLHDEEKFSLSVYNDGSLITKEDGKKLFTMFYRTDKAMDKMGSGLGLFFSHQLAEMHHGSLALAFDQPQLNHFVLSLPIHQEMEFEDDYSTDSPILDETTAGNEVGEQAASTVVGSDALDTILVVEDQKELRDYLVNELKNGYNVVSAANGKSALNILQSQSVSLVLSDVMMPVMNGFELCKSIKTDVTISHVPVVLLTAKTALDAKLEGLELGADDYIEKPFSMVYLRARIDNMLKNRKRLLEEYSKKPLSTFSAVVKNKTEKDFLDKFNELIEKELDNSDLNVEDMASALGMGQSTFYRKIKAVTNMSPNDYVRLVRLKKGADLLLNSNMRINEIAYTVGFSSASYFSSCFLKQFGQSPTEFVKQQQKNDK